MTKTKAAHTPGPQIPENAQDKIFRAYDGGFKPFGHSKGPWVNDNGRILANDGGMGILVAVTQTPVNGLPADVLDANARLIAAAPDLLEAAKIVAYWELSDSQLTESTRGEFADGVGGGRVNRQDYRKAFDTLRAAIAKAEGR